MHDGPQKMTTTGRPRSEARSNGWPSSVVPTMGGAGSPTAAWPSAEPWLTYHHTPAVVATAMARATRIRRRDVMDPRIDRYWTVAVPVIVGWTVQR